MTDEASREVLSRSLDGDLDSDEERELAARLEAEPALRAELEAMRRVRRSVAAFASSERVPPELDTLVDPLLRGKPTPVVVRPWARWLATAAAVILGVTVIIEVNRRTPGPNIESIARASKERHQAVPTERFSLAPLPTSSLPPEQRPLGASDRLLASPIAEVELDDPAALEIFGPLEKGERPVAHEDMTGDAPAGVITESSAVAADTDAKKSRGDQPGSSPSRGDRAQAPEREEKLGSLEAGRGAALRSWDAAPPMGRGQLFVFIDGESAWREFIPAAMCKPGRYAVRIVVAGGAVREARPVGGAASASPSQRLCAAGLVLDLEIEGVADGEYPAEVVVEPRGSGS
jgi:hypothetical protein